MSKAKNYNCLFRIPNTDDNRSIIKEVRKMMKDYGTKWQITVRGRKPKHGYKYSYGGGLKIENAQELGIYLYLKPSVASKEWESRRRSWDSWIKQGKQQEKEKWQDRLQEVYQQVVYLSDDIGKYIE